ncbi:MAG: hypothetical protein ACRDY0_05165 [Acidimicrobiales bacterium]
MTAGRYANDLSCADLQSLAAELGLGVLAGVPRARAIAHLDACPACRAVVDDMAAIGDSLLTLGPEVDPPAGFETRVLARRRAGRPGRPRRRLRMVALAGAVVTISAGAVAAAAGLAGHHGGGFQVLHPAQVSALGGRQLSVSVLRQHGHQDGQVFFFEGQPSWVLMTVDGDGPSRQLTCQLQLAGGQTVTLGTFTVAQGYRSWGATVTVDPHRIRAVRLVDAQGHPVASAIH